jgi:hypothetical protein
MGGRILLKVICVDCMAMAIPNSPSSHGEKPVPFNQEDQTFWDKGLVLCPYQSRHWKFEHAVLSCLFRVAHKACINGVAYPMSEERA